MDYRRRVEVNKILWVEPLPIYTTTQSVIVAASEWRFLPTKNIPETVFLLLIAGRVFWNS